MVKVRVFDILIFQALYNICFGKRLKSLKIPEQPVEMRNIVA